MKIPRADILRADYAATRLPANTKRQNDCHIKGGIETMPSMPRTRLDKIDLGRLSKAACREILEIDRVINHFKTSKCGIEPKITLSVRTTNELKQKGHFPPYLFNSIEITNK